ncbi:cell envelope integrity protein TolA [Salmonella enterica subsp. enterica serovar 50:k:e,n,x,z15]
MAVDLFMTLEPKPESSEDIKARRALAEQRIGDAERDAITHLAQQEEEKEAAAEGVDDMLRDEPHNPPSSQKSHETPVSSASNKTHTYSGGSMAEISAYTAQVSGMIRIKLPAWDTYKGKQCSVVIHTGPDGTLLGTDSYNGDNDLCNYLKEGLRTIDKFPKAPSQSVYSIIKDAPFNFRP